MGRRLDTFAVVLSAALAGCGWPQPGFDAGRTANNTFEYRIGVGNVAGLIASWSSSGAAGVGGTPIVQNGRLIDRSASGIRAVDATTGAPLWVNPASGVAASGTRYGIAATGSIPGRDVVYISTGSFFPPQTGTLGAYDSATGSLIWAKEFGSPVTTAVIVEGRGFVGVYRNVGDANDFTGLVAFDPADGTVLFRVAAANLSQIAALPGTVFVAGTDRLDAVSTGGCGSAICSSQWHAPVTPYAGTVTVAANERVYVGTNLDLNVYEAAGWGASQCAPLWTALGDFRGGLAVASGRLYVSPDWLHAPFNEVPSLRVFDAAGCGSATCTALWQAAEEKWFGPPTVANGVVYATGHIGPTRAWSAAGCDAPQCSALWSSGAVVQGTTTPIVADGRLFSGWDQMQTYVLPST